LKKGKGKGETTDSFFFSYSAEETLALGKKIALKFKGNEVVFLIGELGAGKTVFAKGIAAGLGLENVHEVCSPTFTIMNIYRARVPIYHFDLYRLATDDEIMDLGFEDYVGQGVVIVEWAEKIRFPMEALHVRIVVEDGGRRSIAIR
jgi:tRNA threonylcarbamoyladenosine biosynthesis protein TsaE